MKKLFLVLVLISFGFSAIHAQTAPAAKPAAPATAKTAKPKPAALEVPDVVKKKFATDYPAVKDAKWQKSGTADFAAIYKEGGKDRRIVYGADGSLVRTRIDIDASALPKSANDYVAQNYPNQKISDAVQVTEKGKTWYEVKAGEAKMKFDATGNIVGGKKRGGKENPSACW